MNDVRESDPSSQQNYLLLGSPVTISLEEMLCFLPKDQLWRLQVASTKDPELWAKEWSDEGELVEVKSRQLGGIERRGLKRRQA